MLELRDADIFFKLVVDDYEFKTSDCQEDLNWLQVTMETEAFGKRWTAKGSYLRAEEVKELLSWLTNVFFFDSDNSTISFIENELMFKFDSEDKKLTVILDFDFHPNGKDYDYQKDTEFKLSFDTNKINFKRLFNGLNFVIEKFPERV